MPISKAFVAGRISYSKVRAITRIAGDADSAAADSAAAESALLNLALSGTASHVETVVRAYRRRTTPPTDTAARRSLSWHWDDDGSLVVRGRLIPADGAALIAAINAQKLSPDTVEEGATIDSSAARRADALVATAERFASDARVQLLIDDRTHNRLTSAAAADSPPPPRSPHWSLATAPAATTPAAPTRYLNAHHVRSWLRGGPTDIDNLILICSYHHGVIHDHGYHIRRQPHRWEFRRPDGTTIPATGAPLTGDTDNLIDIAARQGPRITHDLLTPAWSGERLDLEPILDTLLPHHTMAAA